MAWLEDIAERFRILNTRKQIRILGSYGTKRNSSTTSRIRRRRFPAQPWCLWVSKTKRMRRISGLISSSLMPTALKRTDAASSSNRTTFSYAAVSAGTRWVPPLASSAQTTRAILLANAMATPCQELHQPGIFHRLDYMIRWWVKEVQAAVGRYLRASTTLR